MIAPYDIKLQRSSKNVVQPDLMVICDLEDKLDDDDYYVGVPALALFIIQPISVNNRTMLFLALARLFCPGFNSVFILSGEKMYLKHSFR